MTGSIEVRRLAGRELEPWLEAVAALRVAVFRDWPYLYEGDPAYETEYLRAYAASAGAVVVLALDGERVVGASTGLPLADDTLEFQRPFLDAGRPVDDVFYFGESVLLPEYRGRGLGHRFFDEREAHARASGRFRWTAFCAVDRDPADPRRPPGHRGNEAFWIGRGYVRQPGMTVRLAWPEPGDPTPTEKPLTFWLRPLAPSSQESLLAR
ncbi:GNAT family N-acetyltransferase [Arenimonas caeni]|jgi:GNAT superfamily N-acetyltransferase|uniref:GNAT family N-acetyltransferase n=2 Tax=Arenimonas caeni TaxID=2058085 RepID=A0A2P6M777_9GAMM|nr:GNAT family N-acetyltransferase [Arenimonas caeni]MDY0021009.1 GNAT family N-acetyltransferase [Arenimonas caeni]PRH81820.1 GNAT family N-acetyltransferase [Arenimonas caeni]